MSTCFDLITLMRKCRKEMRSSRWAPVHAWQAAMLLGQQPDSSSSNNASGDVSAADIIPPGMTEMITSVPCSMDRREVEQRISSLLLNPTLQSPTGGDSAMAAQREAVKLVVSFLCDGGSSPAAVSSNMRRSGCRLLELALTTGADTIDLMSSLTSWCRFFGELAFREVALASVTTELQTVQKALSLAPAVSVLRCVGSLKRSHLILLEVGYAALEWDRVSGKGQFASIRSPGSSGALRAMFPAVVTDCDTTWLRAASKVVTLFFDVWGRCAVMFNECWSETSLAIPLVNTPPEQVDAEMSQQPQQQQQQQQTVVVQASDGLPRDAPHHDGSYDQADTIVGARSSAGVRLVLPVSNQEQQQPTPPRNTNDQSTTEKGGVANKLLSLFKTKARSPSMLSATALAIPDATNRRESARTSAAGGGAAPRTAPSPSSRVQPCYFTPLQLGGCSELAKAMSAVFRGPSSGAPDSLRAQKRTLLMIIDNGRVGSEGQRWHHNSVTLGSVPEVLHASSSMQAWVMCFATTLDLSMQHNAGNAGTGGLVNTNSGNSEPSLTSKFSTDHWAQFKAAVFALAGSEEVFTEIVSPGRMMTCRSIDAGSDSVTRNQRGYFCVCLDSRSSGASCSSPVSDWSAEEITAERKYVRTCLDVLAKCWSKPLRVE